MCKTLGKDWKRVNMLLNVAASVRGSKSSGSTHTARSYRYRALSDRKSALYKLDGRYRRRRTELAAAAGLEFDQITVDQCVPFEDVEIRTYCAFMNSRGSSKENKRLAKFEITPEDVLAHEMANLDEAGARLYLNGELRADDIGGLCNYENGDRPVDWAAPVIASDPNFDMSDVEDMSDSVDQETLDAFRRAATMARQAGDDDETIRRRMGILTTVEKLIMYRRFHCEHVT